MAGALKVFGFAAMILIAFGFAYLQRSNLIDPIPLPLTLIGAVIGFVLGLLAATEIAGGIPRRKQVTLVLTLITLPLIGLFAGTVLARSLVLQAAFIGISTTPQMELFVVEDSDERRGRRYRSVSHYWLTVSLPEAERDFSVHIDQALYDAIGPRPVSDTHCIRLPVDQGRWGVRRALAPTLFNTPLSVSEYRTCVEPPSY